MRANLFEQLRNLIDAVLLRIVTAKRPPQIPVNWSKISRRPAKLARVFVVGPLGPNVDTLCAQVRFTRITRKKPEQLFRHPAKRHTLRRDYRKPFAQIETSLKS